MQSFDEIAGNKYGLWSKP